MHSRYILLMCHYRVFRYRQRNSFRDYAVHVHSPHFRQIQTVRSSFPDIRIPSPASVPPAQRLPDLLRSPLHFLWHCRSHLQASFPDLPDRIRSLALRLPECCNTAQRRWNDRYGSHHRDWLIYGSGSSTRRTHPVPYDPSYIKDCPISDRNRRMHPVDNRLHTQVVDHDLTEIVLYLPIHLHCPVLHRLECRRSDWYHDGWRKIWVSSTAHRIWTEGTYRIRSRRVTVPCTYKVLFLLSLKPVLPNLTILCSHGLPWPPYKGRNPEASFHFP